MAAQSRSGKKAHVGINCPHCGKYIKLNPPGRFQRAIPCPQCRVPIDVEYIEAQEEEAEETE